MENQVFLYNLILYERLIPGRVAFVATWPGVPVPALHSLYVISQFIRLYLNPTSLDMSQS